jgi:hypothetical protein
MVYVIMIVLLSFIRVLSDKSIRPVTRIVMNDHNVAIKPTFMIMMDGCYVFFNPRLFMAFIVCMRNPNMCIKNYLHDHYTSHNDY